MINNWDELYGYLSLGVSDVFISGELGFDVKRVAAMVQPMGIQLRCFANICQSTWNGFNGFKSFFIRPEDVDYYSNFIDIIEFYNSIEIQSTLYEIYFQSKEWNGNLQEIIKGLKIYINNYYLLGEEFAIRRAGCGKKCIKGERCRLCDRLEELAKTLEESPDYEVYRKQKENK